MRKLIFLTAVLMLTGCAVKQKILDASAVSMTHAHIPAGAKTKDIGAVSGRFCSGDGDKGEMGLMDEAIKNAQKSSKADFIVNATFTQEGSCMVVDGTGQRIVE
jgi:hypothetical protein